MCATYKQTVVLVTSFVVFAAVAANKNLAVRVGGALAIMGMWWVSEILPLEVTSMLPMPLYTLLGIVKASTLAGIFFNGTSFLFCAGFLIGISTALSPARCASHTDDSKDDMPLHILDWKYAKPRFKWDILFIFGGAYMVAEGTVQSGFADVVADEMAQWNISEVAFLILVVTIIAFLTEFIFNMASVGIFMRTNLLEYNAEYC